MKLAERTAERLKKVQSRIAEAQKKAKAQAEGQREILGAFQEKADTLVERWTRVPRRGVIRGLEKEPKGIKAFDLLEGIEHPTKRRVLAMLYENQARMLNRMDETQRAFMVGPYEKAVFGIIRAVYANTILDRIVSIQPLDAPTGRVFYLDVKYTDTKGAIVAGTHAQDATTGPYRGVGYPSEVVENENVGTGDGVTSAQSGNLSWVPVRPGTVSFTDGTQVVRDDGNGNLIGDVYTGGTINYVTGAYSFTYLTAPTSGDDLTCDYEYNMEANANIPQMDVILTSTPVTARQFKLRARWSLEAEQDLKAYHGLSAEDEIVQYQANEINRELCYRVIRTLRQRAQGGSVTWSYTPSAGVPWKWHKEELFDKFVELSELIFEQTQRWGATWAICGVNVIRIIETLDRFVPAGGQNKESAGIQYVGTLGDFEVFKDPASLNRDEWLMGYKGEGLLYTGFIHAVYIGLYTTPTVTLDDFLSRKGMATRAAQKMINSRMYGYGRITA